MALPFFKKGKERAAEKELVRVLAEKPEQKTTVAIGGSQLVRAHITEKATGLAQKNQYVFAVQPGASKKEIERSVQKAYGVNVLGVRIINVRPKAMRLGRTKGIKKGYKKAIVQLKEGQKIDILPT